MPRPQADSRAVGQIGESRWCEEKCGHRDRCRKKGRTRSEHSRGEVREELDCSKMSMCM